MELARTFVERLMRGVTIQRALPSRFAPTSILVSPDSQLKYLKLGQDAFDAGLLRTVDEHVKRDSTVWDIGANVGVFAFAAASIARDGCTFAVEADIWLAQLMRRSLRLKSNRKLNITVLPAAISDRNGIAKFLIANRGRASNALEAAGGRSQTGGIRDTMTVPTLTLDTLLEFIPSPTIVKIDVEGAELMVLKGAIRLLQEVRPTIYIEVGAESDDEIAALLREHGYLLYDGSMPLKNQSPNVSCAFNTLAVPN